MHPLYLFAMIGAGYIFIAAMLIVALIVCITITVTASRISGKHMKAEAEKEKADDVSEQAENTDTDSVGRCSINSQKRRHRKGRKNGKTG